MAAQFSSRALLVGSVWLSTLGMIISVYAYHVEVSVEKDPSFRALCDISERISCSKVFSSRYGKGFGVIDKIFGKESFLNQPNSVYGMMFYLLETVLAFFSFDSVVWLQLVLAVSANLGCVYLAYILYFVLEDMCIVCISSYIVNAFILLCSVMRVMVLVGLRQEEQESKKMKKKK
ncbi:hypothetical protein CHS0354_038883 [Potamilus streckersoni]|uniref:vitamin-K-epoxide reductase (warfarin-sensitive) n=1 Tax=Potamilus streckersoni TaxID=2493646 RepID=A0AAE0W0X7_9BIVA|nr:hypothetical protein CHS0354_038883 [Potamilus streckersoni]